MSLNKAKKIYPCPFSKSYGIPVEQAWSLLKIFFVYRFIVSSLFVILFMTSVGPSLLGTHDAQLFKYASVSYLFFSLLSGILIFWRVISYKTLAQILIFTEIIFLTLLMHASGGINSGMGVLLAVSIAAGGMLIGGRCGLVFAAFASLAILTEQIYAVKTHAFNSTSFTYSGMLGALFFTIAYLSYTLAKRTEQSEILAATQQQTILNLEELNQYVIQHLQSGIIISNSEQQITMCNESALNIINTTNQQSQPESLGDISSQLSDCFVSWQKDRAQDIALLQLPNQNEIHSRFSLIETSQATFNMIIIEDMSLYNQRLQQNKLASLGHLTASIAHEIRNPLGAISHAGQLLSEAPELSTQDRRLTSIIQSHCQRVNKIIEDILQLSRRHPSKKEKINLNQWMPNYLQGFIQGIDSDPEQFEIIDKDADLWIYMDTGHLKQILDNICSNALKYGNTSTDKICIVISLLKNTPCISILDNGDKISPETLKNLFQPFFTTSPTGTGLGLYISKELAELNQAELNYAVTADNKSSFILSLPHADSTKIEI